MSPLRPDPHAALAGASLIVTRPAAGADGLVRAITARGGTALRLPGLALCAVDNLRAARAALRRARADDDWIFVSPAAARFAWKLLPDLKPPRRVRVFAVGEGTARALARHGIAAIAPDTTQDSEGLLDLPELARLRGHTVAIVGAPGGRGLLAPALRKRGARVEEIHVYRRAVPRLDRRHFAAVTVASAPLFTLLSSGEALTQLVAILPPVALARLRKEALVVSSVRLAGLAADLDFDEIVLAASANPRDLLVAVEHALARHRL